MHDHGIEQIRTLALFGQAGAGKTSIVEALLARAGALSAAGSVEAGTTVGDYTPLEKKLQHSLKLSVASFDSRDGGETTRVHLLDTPGYPDFVGTAVPALAAVETAAVVVNAQRGIESMTTRLMKRAKERGLDRIIIVNRIDAENVNLEKLLAELQEAFGPECLPLNLPAAGATRVSDCFFLPSGESDFSSVARAHRRLVDQVVEVDEELMALYLEQGDIEPTQLHDPLERALREGHLVPVVFTSAKTGAGIAELLDVIVKLLPNPLEGNPPVYVNTPIDGTVASELTATPDISKHVLAHAFKIEIDPYVGRIACIRVHQGRIAPGMQLYVGDHRKPFKVNKLYRVCGKQHTETPEAVPGDIVAITKVDEIEFDHILHDATEDAHIHVQPLNLPAPVFGLAVTAKNRGDEQKLSEVLHKLAAEDPSFKVEHNAESNETVMRGGGELHLRCLLEKIAMQYKLELDTRPPSIPYRETISVAAEGHNRHKKQTGGAGQFGEVSLRIEPLPRGAGFEFLDQTKGGVIPGQYIPAVEKGVRAVLGSGFVAGYPIEDVRVVVLDGKYHSVDSKEVAFVAAGRKAFIDALGKSRPVVLEPIVNLEVVAPENAMGDVAGDLSSRRGHITGSDTPRSGTVQIKAQAPLAELESFSARLTSMTAGFGRYSMELSHYDAAPPPVQQKLIEKYKPAASED